MIIPVTLPPKDSNPKLPSGLVKISHDEIVLIELQGVLEVELNNPTERNGRLVGKLRIDDATVSCFPSICFLFLLCLCIHLDAHI